MEVALARLGMRHTGLAINHWSVAVETMQANHPDVETKRMSVEEAVPAELVPGGVVDLLWASPSCTHHSRAKGGKPRSNQLRAQPELILTWLDQLFVRRVIVENVPEFVQWGPLGRDGRPIKRLAGACFAAWVEALKARNYAVEWRVVNCADYGDATTRKRFFLKAVRRGCGRIRWPEATHARNPERDLFGRLPERWRGVRECLDLSDTGRSIFGRKVPLAENTLRRIAVGMARFNGIFLMDMLGTDGGDLRRIHGVEEPLPTQHAGGNRCAVVSPFIVRLNRNCDVEKVEKPLSTVTTSGNHHVLCQPLVLDHFRNGEATDGSEPLGAQTTHDRFSVVTPYIVNNNMHNMPRPLDEPVHALTTGNHAMLCTPLVIGQQSEAQARPVDEPCPTIATAGAVRVATPVILDKAVGLPQLPDGRYLDIRIRMLKPSELAAAHSFPEDYVLTGNRTEQVKQIGNSVPVRTAAAMCEVEFGAA